MPATLDTQRVGELIDQIANRPPPEAMSALSAEGDITVADTLQALNPTESVEILEILPRDRRARVLAAAAPDWVDQWMTNGAYAPGTVGRLMAPTFARFKADMTVAEATEILRTIVRKALVSYAFVVDEESRLIGVLAFREMLLAQPQQRVSEIMVREPFYLRAQTQILEAMREMLKWHLPAYPVCDNVGRLLGVVRGADLFEQQAVDLSAQAGSMVGVEKEERLATPWTRSFRLRHPWLQANLLTAFGAAAVVGVFQDTIDRVVALAVFLPVLAGQSANSGSQAMAITVRGITIGELASRRARDLVWKEAWLGLVNGSLVALSAGLGMLAYAVWSGSPYAATLAAVVSIAMVGSCVLSGACGVLVPVLLRKAGADPASASSIVLTSVTDCISIGLFLGLASLIIP